MLGFVLGLFEGVRKVDILMGCFLMVRVCWIRWFLWAEDATHPGT